MSSLCVTCDVDLAKLAGRAIRAGSDPSEQASLLSMLFLSRLKEQDLEAVNGSAEATF